MDSRVRIDLTGLDGEWVECLPETPRCADCLARIGSHSHLRSCPLSVNSRCTEETKRRKGCTCGADDTPMVFIRGTGEHTKYLALHIDCARKRMGLFGSVWGRV